MDILVTKYKPNRKRYRDVSGTLKFIFHSFIEVELLPHVELSPNAYDVVCVTSHRAVDWVLAYGLSSLSMSQFVCLTSHQAERLKAVDLRASAIQGEHRSFLEKWLREQSKLTKVLLLKGNQSLLQSVSGIEERIVYKTTLASAPLKLKRFDAILFYSPSGVRGFSQGKNEISKNCRVFALGDTTADAIRNHLTKQVSVSPEAEEEAFIHYVKDELSYR